ncbi:MAG: twin-arginine translocase subunit TatB [Gammaproteobacteria bacterium]|nr:twin-arginine translocase subunit TatB [Gammaproteobacteria bacterium]NIN62492.1 twin-arginine translocase subunit TatB [Gammaproteobacteria bacterium]NIO62875.1 twin-arginine translocase subunit TatB [Gammaproteobacteria bacterium]NIP49967.1 twin-arginine translocase subunit TatB [Gammaproteobacteria bacterium]NIQ12186.1 twin-arginine translocase subunit TatB [Gammaproteobacteria bacterium]
MFDIGFWELVLIGIVGLLIIGPDKLPEVSRNLGRWIGKTRRFINQTRRELEQELGSPTDYHENLTDLDELMRDAPDQDPDYKKKDRDEEH